MKVKKIAKDPADVVIDESKMDRLLHYLHEADPRDASGDPPDIRELAGKAQKKITLFGYILKILVTKYKKVSNFKHLGGTRTCFRRSKRYGPTNRRRVRKGR